MPINARLVALATTALAAGLIAAGCGGGDDSSTSSTTAAGATGASGAEGGDFVAQANAICAAGNKEIDAAFQSLGKNPTQQQQEQEIQNAVVPSIQGQIDDIRELTPPADIQDDVTSFLDDAQNVLDEVKADPTSIGGSFKPINKQADALGLHVCAD